LKANFIKKKSVGVGVEVLYWFSWWCPR